jgi:hypothetical protein
MFIKDLNPYPGGEHISTVWKPRAAILLRVPAKSARSDSLIVHIWNPTGILTGAGDESENESNGNFDRVKADPSPRTLFPRKFLLEMFFIVVGINNQKNVAKR